MLGACGRRGPQACVVAARALQLNARSVGQTGANWEHTMIQWSAEILDQLIAPGISEFHDAQVPDLSGEFSEAEHWLANHFLNTVFGARFKDGHRQVAVAFLRRAQDALAAYCDARSKTALFLEKTLPGNPGVGRYYAAVAAWETFALQCAMAIDLFRWLNSGEGAFQRGDGSAEFRLYTIANHIKHTAACVESDQCLPDHTVPLWLSSAGLQSFGHSVSYQEASEILRAICRLADKLQNPGALAPQA